MVAIFGMEIPTYLISFIFVFLGTLGRTYYPYFKKVKEIEELNRQLTAEGKPIVPRLNFDYTYLELFIANIFVAFFATVLFFATWSPPEGTLFQVAIASLVAGWGLEDMANRIAT